MDSSIHSAYPLQTNFYSPNFKTYKHLGLVCYSEDLDKDFFDEIEAKNRSRIASKIDLNNDEILNEILDEDEIKESLEVFVNKHCFYRQKPLRKYSLNDLESLNCYRYVIQTFTETRKTSYASEPYNPYYTDQPFSTCDNPWSVRVKPSRLFYDETVRLEIPGTSHIENCEVCQGEGSRTCGKCRGSAKKTCNICKGSGYSDFGVDCPSYESLKHNYNDQYNNGFESYRTQYQIQSLRNQYYNYRSVYSANSNNLSYPMDHIYCIQCNGKGFVTCRECEDGEILCRPCNSSGKVRWYVELEVLFENYEDELIENPSQISEDLIFNCASKQIYFEQKEKLKPIKDNDFFKLYKSSKTLINTHLSKFSFSRILAQRQIVYLIPVTSGCLQNRGQRFLIYGMERKVHFPNYP
ncbi:Suppressor of Stomatin mutant Uncoordination, partial [Brachionus plicatilis]